MKNDPHKIKLVVTSGPTREFIDPVRFLSNPSTGKMGYYIARAGVARNFQVSYICGPVQKEYQNVDGARNLSVISTDDMLQAVLSELEDNSILIMAAAPADYRPEERAPQKIKKTDKPVIHFVSTPDILKTAGQFIADRPLKNVHLVGFAAETDQLHAYASKKLREKNLDLIFLNDVSASGGGFASDQNQLTVIRRDESYSQWQSDSKENLGFRVLDEIISWLEL